LIWFISIFLDGVTAFLSLLVGTFSGETTPLNKLLLPLFGHDGSGMPYDFDS
jgi:hypothetical protein